MCVAVGLLGFPQAMRFDYELNALGPGVVVFVDVGRAAGVE